MTQTSSRGQWVWHELLTSDPAAAQRFYGTVVGWKPVAWDKDPSYTLWMNGPAPVGGVMRLPDAVKAMGAPPHWLPYLSTPDVDATSREVTGLGGKVLKPPTDIPGAGRFSVLADPQGAVFGVYVSATEQPAPGGQPNPGEFSWHELATTDPVAGLGFYVKLFGWEKAGEFDMGPMGVYQMYGFGGVPMGGIYRKPAEMPAPPNWLSYAMVPNADAAAEKAKGIGGKVVQEPMEVPGGGRIAVCLDPQGVAFAVHSKS